jgi:hypothetical protein
VIDSPDDKSIIQKASVLVSFEVVSENVARLEINGNVLPVSPGAGKPVNTTVDIPSLGKYSIKIKCLDAAGSVLNEYKIRLVRLPLFKDVPESFWASDKIAYMSALHLIGGYPDGKFKPGKSVTRAELTSVLVKASDFVNPEPVESTFKDVRNNNWAAFYIMKGVALQYVSGYPDNTFRPTKTVTRAEGVTIIARFEGLGTPEYKEAAPYDELIAQFAGAGTPVYVKTPPFNDVPLSYWAIDSIISAKDAGLLDYLHGKPFLPEKALTRAEVAAILSRTTLAKAKKAELVNWETGF